MLFIMLILLIVYSNNFDSFNRISFIFLNIPINEYIQKIKNKNGIYLLKYGLFLKKKDIEVKM